MTQKMMSYGKWYLAYEAGTGALALGFIWSGYLPF